MGKKALRVFGTTALLLGLAAFACGQTRRLTILHTNDMHSAMVPFGPNQAAAPPLCFSRGPAAVFDFFGRSFGDGGHGGLARIARLIKMRRAAGGNVLALDAGDVFVGSFEFNKYLGYPELKIMENLYDAMELGNHEFDLGLDALAGILSGQIAGGPPVSLPLLCANVDFTGTYLSSIIQPSITRSMGGIKVGIFGVVNEDPQNYSADVVARMAKDVFVVAGTEAASLRGQGCDVVVCVSHLGTAYDIGGLANVPGIDVIVGGHSHDVFKQPVIRNGKIIVQAGDYGRFLGELSITLRNGSVKLERYILHPITSDVMEDPQVRAQVNAVRDGVVDDPRFGPVYTLPVALAVQEIAHDWPKIGPNRDSALGNLVTDAFKAGAAKKGQPVDLALDVLGYMAGSLPAGKIVGNDIMRAVPYGYDPESGLGFKLVVVPLPGYLLLGGLEYAADMVTLTSDLAIQTSGLTYTYDSSKPPVANLGEISRLDPSSVRINGKPVDPAGFYSVVMSEQVFNFLNNLAGNQLQSIPTGLFEYTAVRDFMKGLKTVRYASQGRVKDTAASIVR